MRGSCCSVAPRPRRAKAERTTIWPSSAACAYDAVVLGVLGRRGVEAGISVFAVLGFCYVPLGGHTGFEHAKAVLSTPAAKRAGAELIEALIRVRARLAGELEQLAAGAVPTSVPPNLPPPKRDGGPHHDHQRESSP